MTKLNVPQMKNESDCGLRIEYGNALQAASAIMHLVAIAGAHSTQPGVLVDAGTAAHMGALLVDHAMQMDRSNADYHSKKRAST